MDMGILLFAFVFLMTASVFVPVAKLIGLGPIIGYIAAGILIGPSGLKLIGEPETVLHFSEFGVVMMLFLIGLELRPAELWQMRGKLLGLGGLQVGVTLAALYFGMRLFNVPIDQALVLAMALTLSSTAVALQIMQDNHLLETTSGRSGFSILLFQDVIVIAMIAAIPIIAALGSNAAAGVDVAAALPVTETGHGPTPSFVLPRPTGIWYSAAVIGVFAGMILSGRLLLKPIFRLIARARVRETFTAIALAQVVGASLLMSWLGLSAALGAFFGGVVLADSEYRHQLERDIEPFKALLLGLFFISVGMSIDLSVITADPALIIASVIALCAVKFLILFGVTRTFRLATPAALRTAVLLCQAGEFGFVLFQFALAKGILSQAQISQASAIIAFSMTLTPLLLIVFNKLVAPRFSSPSKTGDAPDDERETVLILGFGRIGQIAYRLLQTQGISATLIDHDGDQIEFVRRFGHRVFFGDATDLDLLRKAGAEQAKVIIISVDDPGQILRAARLCKEHFPQARLIARAHNRNHMFELMAIGVDFVERETVRAALALGRQALRSLGYGKERSDRIMDAFLRYDFQMIQDTWQHRGDIDKLVETAAQTRDFLRRTLNDEHSVEELEEVLAARQRELAGGDGTRQTGDS